MECKLVKIRENREISSGIFSLTFEGPFISDPGQFFMVKLLNSEAFLPRPISVHDVDKGTLTMVYAVVGKGTSIMTSLKAGDQVQLTGPLGVGFDPSAINGRIALVSGGIGIAPFKLLVKTLAGKSMDLFCGFRHDVYLTDELEPMVDHLYISTEDGSTGHKGFITDILRPEEYDIVITCGPEPMMHKVVSMCRAKGVPSFVSTEARMACGVGACLVCTCKTVDGNKRTCKDGPVFRGEELMINA